MPEKQTRVVETLAKTFDPAHFEERWYSLWEREGRFQPKGPAGSPRFVMVIPPPNVTGRLHIGHAYGRTIEDILARWQRMRGRRVLWLPGTDHAGIATQMVVERELAKQGIRRRDLGREEFIERVWAWRRDSGDAILAQLRRLGCSLDWSRLRFTHGPGSLAGRAPRLRSALSRRADLPRALRRQLVPAAARPRSRISRSCTARRRGRCTTFATTCPGVEGGAVVATTRPETMLGDTALAIHPRGRRAPPRCGGAGRSCRS